jgi:hypothetical protein
MRATSYSEIEKFNELRGNSLRIFVATHVHPGS